MCNLTPESMISFLNDSKPRIIFEMDIETLKQLRKLHDYEGRYLWKPSALNDMGYGTLLGCEITISKEKCLRLRYLFQDGTSKYEEFNL